MRAVLRLAFLLALVTACADPPPPSAADAGTKAATSTPSDTTPHDTTPHDTTPREDPLAPTKGRRDGKGPPVRADGTIYAESELMGTHVSINLWLEPDRTSTEAGVAIQAAFDEIARIERLTSEWIPTSEVSRLNAAAGGEAMTISAELFAVLLRSRQVSERSGGAFDVTFHAVGELWTFTPGSKPPSAAAIAEKLPLVDWRRIELDASTRKARLATAGMKVGLGAIAKGYAVDRASNLLIERGFHNHIVEGGGDTYVAGTKNGKPWSVGVQDPEKKGVVGVLPSSDVAVVTSGDYERFFELDGKRYAHILDPQTGAPLLEESSCKSITALAPNATDADAYATAIAVLGPERGMALVEEVPDLEAILITRKNEVLVSSGLQSTFVRTPLANP